MQRTTIMTKMKTPHTQMTTTMVFTVEQVRMQPQTKPRFHQDLSYTAVTEKHLLYCCSQWKNQQQIL